MEKVVIGIDPGSSGAIAWRGCNGKRHVINMPETPKDILDSIREICNNEIDSYGDILPKDMYVCVLEDVGHGLPGQSSKATATFARHNGHLEMALLSEGIKTIKVVPQKWMKTFAISKDKVSDKNDWKRVLKSKAQELYPNIKVTLKNADALLILEYAVNNKVG